MKNLVLVVFLAVCASFSSVNANVIGLYEGADGAQIDFNVLTYTRGIAIDARLDPSVDNRRSALQQVTMTSDQYREIFESDKTIEQMKLGGVFDSVADAKTEDDQRKVTITETFSSDGDVLVTKKVLEIKIKNQEIESIKLQTKVRRGLLGIVPLWMAKVFNEKVEVTKVKDGLLLRDDGHEFCRVTNSEAIDQGALGGDYQELSAVCNQN